MQNEVTPRQILDGISALLAVMTPDGALEIVNRPILEYFGKTARRAEGVDQHRRGARDSDRKRVGEDQRS